jgi:hypothetical protein
MSASPVDNTEMTNTFSGQSEIGTRVMMGELDSTLSISHNTFTLARKIVGLVEG